MSFTPPKHFISTTPSNVAAEGTILSALSRNSLLIHMHNITPAHFYDARNKALFECIESISRRSKSNSVTIAEIVHRANQKNMIDFIGGENYVSALLDKVHSEAYISTAFNMARDAEMQRRAQESIKALSVEILGKTEHEMAALFNKHTEKVFENYVGTEEKGVYGAFEELFSELDDIDAGLERDGIVFGVKPFDKAMGVQKSQYCAVAADSGVGKTAITCNFALANWKRGKKGIFFSEEMTTRELLPRFLAIESGISLAVILGGHMEKHQRVTLEKARRTLEELISKNGQIYDNPGMTIDEVEAITLAFERSHGKVDFICVDYIQAIQLSGAKFVEDFTRISLVSKRLQGIKKNHDCFVWALSQVTIDSNFVGELNINHVAGSKEIKKNADLVLLLNKTQDRSQRQDYCDLMTAHFAKGRSQDRAKFELIFNPMRMGYTGTQIDITQAETMSEEDFK